MNFQTKKMIQRIQTIYLLLIQAITSALFFIPFSEFTVDNQIYYFNFKGIFTETGELITSIYPVIILLSLISLLTLITVFIYKNRNLQIRLSIFNLLLNIGLVGIVVYYILSTTTDLNSVVSYKIAIVLPIISVILYILAIKSIKKDEDLIKSLDRIR